MKSLSITIFLSTLLTLVVSAALFVSPVSAETIEQPFTSADPQAIVRDPVAPLTGETVVSAMPNQRQNAVSAEAASALAATFTMNLSKAPAAAPAVEAKAPAAPSLNVNNFAASVANGKANQVTGLYVQDLLAYPVGGQGGNAAFVTSTPNEVTMFEMAASYGSQAFLAHNYLAGGAFFQLKEGQTVTLVHGDGSTHEYRIETIRRFQALSPNSTQSRFVDLDNNQEMSASGLFAQIYNQNNPVVLQTCIEKDGISTWGRMFIIAVPVNG